MPPTRWSCDVCGTVNRPHATTCERCNSHCPVDDSGVWTCPDCSTKVNARICPSCQHRQPLSKEGVAQIFEGMKFVFTGIIPKSLPHSSEWREWQQASQRGAQPMNEISPEMTHLIYKEGFEKSDKVRKTQKLGHNIKIVASEWFYQSIAVDVKLDESPYTLHGPQKKLVAATVQGPSRDIATAFASTLLEIAGNSDISSASGGGVRVTKSLTEDGNFMWLVPPNPPKPLFQDFIMAFSPSVPQLIIDLAVGYSAKTGTLATEATYYVVAKKDEGLPEIATAREKQLKIVPVEWIQHCVQLHEIIPNVGCYSLENVAAPTR
eukprot:TRINITY_DN842_c1_g1_i2.p1 TRINITY_DN842_c1_g1~~TRINITY_DN842_c1_g1_i2.p1  ORF type:complete len:321 (+),score=57.21 TRINITY_DN842_c1_g1_i2:128-1090(+)